MILRIVIDMDGAAFEDAPDAETRRVLEAGMIGILACVEYVAMNGEAKGIRLRDINGNACGRAHVEP